MVVEGGGEDDRGCIRCFSRKGVGGERLQAKLLNGWRRSSPKNVIIKTNVEF